MAVQKKKDQNEEQKPYWLIYVIAGALILFSFFAPLVFTQPGKVDFRDTGPIGDTIGGIMGPFIALAGVIVTFLAFIIQKRANDILSRQHREEKEAQHDLCIIRYRLFVADIEFAQEDLNKRIEELNRYYEYLTQDIPVIFKPQSLPKYHYKRMSESDRERFFEALTSVSISDPIASLDRYYSISDYMLSHADGVNAECMKFSKDTYSKLLDIKKSINTILDCFSGDHSIGFAPASPNVTGPGFICDFKNRIGTFEPNEVSVSDLKRIEDAFRALSDALTKASPGMLGRITTLEECRNNQASISSINKERESLLSLLESHIKELERIKKDCDKVLKDYSLN